MIVWDKGLAIFHSLNKLNCLYSPHTLCRYQCTTVGRVGNRYVWQGGQTENQGGQTKFFLKQMFAHPGHKPCRRPCVKQNVYCIRGLSPEIWKMPPSTATQLQFEWGLQRSVSKVVDQSFGEYTYTNYLHCSADCAVATRQSSCDCNVGLRIAQCQLSAADAMENSVSGQCARDAWLRPHIAKLCTSVGSARVAAWSVCGADKLISIRHQAAILTTHQLSSNWFTGYTPTRQCF